MRMVTVDQELETIEFAKRTAAHFLSNPQHHTFTDGDVEPGCLLAMRWGMDNDCVLVMRLDDSFELVNFQNIIREVAQ